MTHTPGPWWTDAQYREEEYGIPIIAARTDCGPLPGNPTRGMVAWANEVLPENSARCQADARLIAAAPCLLEALENLANAAGATPGFASPMLLKDARDLIARARGAA
jgi:hypothetical protein